MTGSAPARVGTWRIIGYVYFTFICYLSIGLPLAVLPPYVHLRMGYSAVLAGLVISVQYIATLASRPWAGRISDRKGAKVSVIWGMAACTASGVALVAAAALYSAHTHWLSFWMLILSRLILGVGESLGSTGATLWGITAAGPENTARVISYNGICTYGAMALGAPLGVVFDQIWGLGSLGILTILVGALSIFLAVRKAPVPIIEGEHLPFSHVLGRVAPHGMGLALGGFGFSLVFPAIGVEAVKRVPENNRGTALGVFTAFADVSFFLVGPIAGAIIGWFGYRSVFLFALLSVLCALGIVVVLRQTQPDEERPDLKAG